MTWLITPHTLLLANLVVLICLFVYLARKIRSHRSVLFFEISLIPIFMLTVGHYAFESATQMMAGAIAIMLGILLTPITILPLSHYLGRDFTARYRLFWKGFYITQAVWLGLVMYSLAIGDIIEWVTGILDQPIIVVSQGSRYLFFNVIISNIIAFLYLDRTLQHANEGSREKLKFVFIAYLGLTVYFSYLAGQIVLSSYVSEPTLRSGTAVIFCALVLLAYSFYRYPVWEVKLSASRSLIFGFFSMAAIVSYLFISGGFLDVLRWASPNVAPDVLPIITFTLVAVLLGLYISPKFRSNVRNFFATNVFRNKYDYRDLWMKFSNTSSRSLNIRDVLPLLANLIAEAMFVRQVVIWLRSPTSDTFQLAYRHDSTVDVETTLMEIRLSDITRMNKSKRLFTFIIQEGQEKTEVDKGLRLMQLGIDRLTIVEKDNIALALLGIGQELRPEKSSTEDEHLLNSVANQLGNLILTHKLSEELLLSREWDSFNRFASFILHDLKNLATLQGMTLENAKHLSHNSEFTADAFATFQQTTDKMINLIASLSVQRGQFSLKQQSVNILEVLSNTFDDLKIGQRDGVRVHTKFPPVSKPPIISGDPELLRKAFTNLLLNAIQSLPQGEGAVEVSVSQQNTGRVTAAIQDTGCGIPPEKLQSLFRPFQSTKEKGMGIGLCHTRSIIEVHGGQIRIESEVNAGTRVEIDLPTM
jgi:putative PEP-CTERM system histidine kinase